MSIHTLPKTFPTITTWTKPSCSDANSPITSSDAEAGPGLSFTSKAMPPLFRSPRFRHSSPTSSGTLYVSNAYTPFASPNGSALPRPRAKQERFSERKPRLLSKKPSPTSTRKRPGLRVTPGTGTIPGWTRKFVTTRSTFPTLPGRVTENKNPTLNTLTCPTSHPACR